MKTRVLTVNFLAGPVRRHPACPAQLTEAAEPHGLCGSCRYRQFDVVVELLAIVEEHQVGQRLAKIAGRQEANISGKIFRENPNPDLVLDAEDAAAKQRVLAKHVVSLAKQGPLGSVEDQARADELVDFGLDAEYSSDRRGETRS